MFFLVTGASGVGKSSVRRAIQAEIAPTVESGELYEIGTTPQWDIAWRHRTTEKAVQRALQLQEEGRHFMLCGDPVPPGELFAVPSADKLEAVAICLLDVSPEEQTARLAARGSADPELLPNHIAFMTWMREHVRNPQHLPVVMTNNAWEEMRWDRWLGQPEGHPKWDVTEIDTTSLTPAEVAQQVLEWVRAKLAEAGLTDKGVRQSRQPERHAS